MHRQAATSGSNLGTMRSNTLAVCKKVAELVHISFACEINLQLFSWGSWGS